MEGALIDDGAGEDGFSIVRPGDGQTREPLGPFAVEMSLEDNLVDLVSDVLACHSRTPRRSLARSPLRKPPVQPARTLRRRALSRAPMRAGAGKVTQLVPSHPPSAWPRSPVGGPIRAIAAVAAGRSLR